MSRTASRTSSRTRPIFSSGTAVKATRATKAMAAIRPAISPTDMRLLRGRSTSVRRARRHATGDPIAQCHTARAGFVSAGGGDRSAIPAEKLLDPLQPSGQSCLGAVFGRGVVPDSSQLVRQILLGRYPMRLAMGVDVILAVADSPRSGAARIAQMRRQQADPTGVDIG